MDIQAFHKDVAGSGPRAAVLDTSHWAAALGQTQSTLEALHLQLAW